MKPGKLQRNKQRSQDLCWKVHDRAQSFILISHIITIYVTVTFLLVSSSGTNHDLLYFVHGKGQKTNKKK